MNWGYAPWVRFMLWQERRLPGYAPSCADIYWMRKERV